jgi:hypothetical protein
MKTGADALAPRRSAMTWPISWMNSSTTNPTAKRQPQMSAYAATDTSIEPDVVRSLSLGSSSNTVLPLAAITRMVASTLLPARRHQGGRRSPNASCAGGPSGATGGSQPPEMSGVRCSLIVLHRG